MTGPERATARLDALLKSIPEFGGRVYFGGPPSEGARNPCIVYSIAGDFKYPTQSNPNRVVSVDYNITVRTNDSKVVEQLGQVVWAKLAGERRIREVGDYAVDKYLASDGAEETESEYFATQTYRLRVK